MPDSGLDLSHFQVKVINTLQVVAFSRGGGMTQRSGKSPYTVLRCPLFARKRYEVFAVRCEKSIRCQLLARSRTCQLLECLGLTDHGGDEGAVGGVAWDALNCSHCCQANLIRGTNRIYYDNKEDKSNLL